jgi:hypothetical protein
MNMLLLLSAENVVQDDIIVSWSVLYTVLYCTANLAKYNHIILYVHVQLYHIVYCIYRTFNHAILYKIFG